MLRRPPRSTLFPTRRSSDLATTTSAVSRSGCASRWSSPSVTSSRTKCGEWDATSVSTRSEEHTSELQSQSNLVCRLLLEKKNHYNNLDSSGKRYLIGYGLHR